MFTYNYAIIYHDENKYIILILIKRRILDEII